jgi:hypothetical protein
MRYMKACRLAALAGLASLALFAVPAVPAGAKIKRVCTTLTVPPYNECHRAPVIRLSANVEIVSPIHPHPIFVITMRVSDPHLIVKLYRTKKKNGTYRFVKTVFNRHVKAGKYRFSIHVDTGVYYELKFTAKVAATKKTSAGSKTITKFEHPAPPGH